MGQLSRTRRTLHKKLKDLIGDRGKVYFQPPESIKISQRAIIYTLSDIDTKSADNAHYLIRRRYTLLVIDPDPDSSISEEILLAFPNSSFDRRYVADNLYHDSLTVYW